MRVPFLYEEDCFLYSIINTKTAKTAIPIPLAV